MTALNVVFDCVNCCGYWEEIIHENAEYWKSFTPNSQFYYKFVCFKRVVIRNINYAHLILVPAVNFVCNFEIAILQKVWIEKPQLTITWSIFEAIYCDLYHGLMCSIIIVIYKSKS